jgi:hypothetical protein
MIANRLFSPIVLAALCGCASAPIVLDKLPQTEAPMRAAEELGAARVPQAALELKLAQDEVQQAKGFAKEGNQQRADMMMLRAQADAELAVALAREAPLQVEARNATEAVKLMQQK